MRLEGDTIGGDFAKRGEGEYLKTSRVGEDGTVPILEGVKTAELFHHVHSWTKHQMVGIAEDNRGFEALKVFGSKGFDGRLCTDGHEDGGCNGAMLRPKAADTCPAFCIFMEDFVCSNRFRSDVHSDLSLNGGKHVTNGLLDANKEGVGDDAMANVECIKVRDVE